MVDLEKYNSLVIDIDDTLIEGWFIDFMDLTWRLFKSKVLSQLLMTIQAKFKLYRVNHRVAELCVKAINNNIQVYFLTTRGPNKGTIRMLYDILPVVNLNIIQLASYNASRDKFEWVQAHSIGKFLLIDDNLKTRLKMFEIGDTIHPKDL